MNFYTKLSVVAALGTGAVLAACGSSTTAPATTASTVATTATGAGGATATVGSGGATTSTGAGGMPMNPPPPNLGAQIDRMGRPAINTVGTKTFNAAQRDAAENAYNKSADPTKWGMLHAADIAASIAILDSLDKADNANPAMAGCGNQAGVATPGTAGAQASGAYNTLAGILADDRLRLRTDGSGACGLYLSVEAGALGITNMLCGGRTPVDDVIDESYSLLAGVHNFAKLPTQTGANGAFPFGDGIAVDAALNTAFTAGFPFFAAMK